MGEPSLGGRWTKQNHLRYLASLALLARVTGSNPPDGLEQAFIAGLDDETGYTQAVACQGLERLGTRTGLKAAVRHLQSETLGSEPHSTGRSSPRRSRANPGVGATLSRPQGAPSPAAPRPRPYRSHRAR